MYTVASPGPNPRGRGQLPNPNECNSTLTSGSRGIYRYLYIDEGPGPCAKTSIAMIQVCHSEQKSLRSVSKTNPVPVQNSFLKRISAISAQSDRLESWRCLPFLKKTAAFHSVSQISLIALPPLCFPGCNV